MKQTREDEAACIARAQQGDVSAFNELVLAYQQAMYSLAYRMLNQAETAADVTQEAFLSAYRNIGSYRGGSFRAWLSRIVSNAAYDQLRHKASRPASSLDALQEEEGLDIAESTTREPETLVLRRELQAYIQEGLQRLLPEQRLTLILSDIQGFSYDEIATITAVSLGTVKSRLARARMRLRDYLQERPELLPQRFRLDSTHEKG